MGRVVASGGGGMVGVLVLGLACTSSSPGPAELRQTSCDHARLAAAAREIEGIAVKDDDTTDIAARAVVEACEIAEIEPYIAMMWRDSPRYDWLPRAETWFALRSYAYPVWDEVVNEGATLPYEQRAAPLWRRCGFSRYGFYDEARFAACGMSPLPFVVYELLRAAQVDEGTAKTLGEALCEHRPADVGRKAAERRGVEVRVETTAP